VRMSPKPPTREPHFFWKEKRKRSLLPRPRKRSRWATKKRIKHIYLPSGKGEGKSEGGFLTFLSSEGISKESKRIEGGGEKEEKASSTPRKKANIA